MTAGVLARADFNYGWHTYSWSTYQPPVDASLGIGVGVWNSFNVTIDPAPDVLDGQGKVNYDGTVTVKFGERPGAYTGQTKPIPVQAGVTFNYRLPSLKRNKTYYVNAFASVIKPAAAGSLAQAAVVQYGEVSASTS